MRNVAIAGIGASVVTFVVAAIMVVTGMESMIGVGAEGLSRASSNLALIAIALGVWFKGSGEG